MAFDYRTLPADDERSIRPFELAPVGSRRFTKTPGDFIPWGIMTLSRGCVVSAPLPGLSPCGSGSPLSHGEGTFLSRPLMNRSLPSAIRLLLARLSRGRRPTKAFLRGIGTSLRSDNLLPAEGGLHSDLPDVEVEVDGASSFPSGLLRHDPNRVLVEHFPCLEDVVPADVGYREVNRLDHLSASDQSRKDSRFDRAFLDHLIDQFLRSGVGILLRLVVVIGSLGKKHMHNSPQFHDRVVQYDCNAGAKPEAS